MTMLITLAQARAHLRVDGDADANDLTLKIHAASAVVLNYLKSGVERLYDSAGFIPLDSAGDPDVPYEVYAATCLMLGYLYKQRDESTDFQMGFVPPAVTALLYPLRDPVVR
jgi:hypothetical protein